MTSLFRSAGGPVPSLPRVHVHHASGEKVTFVVDTDETVARALPGQEYEEDVPPLIEGFYHPSVDDRVYTDEWGSFMSGYSPLPNGRGRYLVGIDMRADEVDRKFEALRCSGMVSLVASLVLALLFSEILGSTMVRRIKTLTSQCQDIPESRGGDHPECPDGDELDMLVCFFDTMSQRLQISRDESRRAQLKLEQSHDKLEVKVEERTRELRELNGELVAEISERKRAEEEKDYLVAELQEALTQVNALRGLLPICSECKEVRDDRGYWNQIEAYISEHSEATFSHGICPDCARKLYPQYFRGTTTDE